MMTLTSNSIRRLLRTGAAATLLGAFVPPAVPHAEPVTDRALADLQMLPKPGCKLLRVGFNVRVRYVSHFPRGSAEELRITLRPIDPPKAAAELSSLREALRVPAAAQGLVKAVELESARADGPTLIVHFTRAVAYDVGPGSDFESIAIAVAGPKGKVCKPELPPGLNRWDTTVRSEVGPAPEAGAKTLPGWSHQRPPGPISAADSAASGAAMDEARAALKKGDYGNAARLFVKVLKMPEHPSSAEAQELLGVVYQKAQSRAQARAEYEDYLRRYPKGDGSEAVRQRLDAIVTADMPREERLRAARSQPGGPDAPAGPSTWTVSGSASQFYVRDDSFRVVRDPTLPPILNADKEDHRVHRNALLSSFDLIGTWNSSEMKSKFRFSGTEEHQFGGDKEIVGVSALFLESTVKDWNTTARIGRQTRNTGGVLGRFDGALVSWQGTPWMRLNVVGGSPVASRRDDPFKDDKVFLGTSVDFGSFFGGFDASFFAIQQQIGDIIDRQAIGAEFRYADARRSAFLTLDYDTHFAEFNAAIFNGSWTFADKSVLHGGLDYRKAPYLTSWNALQGQQVRTLYELLKMRTREEMAQMAVDRTATYTSASVGYSRPLTDKIQLNVDMTAAHIDGTIASFGVDALPSTGTELYYSAQLMGTSLFWDGDLFTMGLRMADRQDSNTYVADFGTRLPIGGDWRVNPRLMLSYREGKTTDLVEYSVLPSVLFNYFLTKDLSFEMEVGARRTWRELAGVKDDDTELFFTLGYRYDFYADGKGACPVSAPRC